MSEMPAGLGESGAELWTSIAGTYTLRADELRVLQDACRQADLIAELEEARRGEPLTTRGSMGQDVINPYISELRAHRTVLSNLLKTLKLPEDANTTARKNTRTSEQARKAARARWGTAKGA